MGRYGSGKLETPAEKAVGWVCLVLIIVTGVLIPCYCAIKEKIEECNRRQPETYNTLMA